MYRLFLALIVLTTGAVAQEPNLLPIESAVSADDGNGNDAPATPAAANEDPVPAQNAAPVLHPQPKRILGIMPNYRAVSAGVIPPPPTHKEAFKIATQNSFDYSAFLFVGFTSAEAELSRVHPKLGHGFEAYPDYYWRGFVDKTDRNYLVIWALPTVLHEDERYYAKGKGHILARALYAASRVLITPDYNGHNTFNASEILGTAMAQGISREYYPKSDRSIGSLAVKFGYAISRDAYTNVFREFWPDIATHVLHRHP